MNADNIKADATVGLDTVYKACHIPHYGMD